MGDHRIIVVLPCHGRVDQIAWHVHGHAVDTVYRLLEGLEVYDNVIIDIDAQHVLDTLVDQVETSLDGFRIGTTRFLRAQIFELSSFPDRVKLHDALAWYVDPEVTGQTDEGRGMI